MSSSGVILQVLICTYGAEGIERVAESIHPEVEGVEYLVSWQASEGVTLPESLRRDDFRIYRTRSKGLSCNRNHALSKSTAPLLLVSDDDVSYSEKGLRSVIENFREHPEVDIITFRFESASVTKCYPSSSFHLDKVPKGYFVSSIEIAFRRDAVKGKIWFNENFGIGAMFSSGEEDIFIKDCLDSGLTGIYVPQSIAVHDQPTTSSRNLLLPERPLAKGAVFIHLHPSDWFLRMIAHALREIHLWRKGDVPSPFSFCRNWLKGARMAKKHQVFPTPDYSLKYDCHEAG